MVALLLTVAAIAGGGIWFFWKQAVQPEASDLWVKLAIFAMLICIFFLFWAGRLILKEHRFKKRLSGYIMEGHGLLYNPQDKYTAIGYWDELNKWSGKASQDISKNVNKNEADILLNHVDQKATLNEIQKQLSKDKDKLEFAMVGVINSQRVKLLENLRDQYAKK